MNQLTAEDAELRRESQQKQNLDWTEMAEDQNNPGTVSGQAAPGHELI